MTCLDSVPKPFVIGIAGGVGAGKCDVAASLFRRFEHVCTASVLNQDAYYRDLGSLSLAGRHTVNFDDPASLDHDLLLRDLQSLVAGTPIRKPRYCFNTKTRSLEFDLITPTSMIVVEGLFAFWDPRLRDLMNYKLYLNIDSDLRFIRRLFYDVQNRGRTLGSVITQYLTSSRPMHQLYVEPTKVYADRVVNNLEAIEQAIAEIERSATAILSNQTVNLSFNTSTLPPKRWRRSSTPTPVR